MTPYSPQLRGTLDRLSHCHGTCLSMAVNHCLALGGEHARPQHMRLMLDCVDICALARDAVLRKSQFHTSILALCAEICGTCGKACDELGQMEECAAACRACMEACRQAARLDHAGTLTAAERITPG